MDVAKYIGLFLLKNNFCYIHGLGNLELKKKPASYNGDVLLPPSYDVVLSPAGSIDDNLANFVATNEQISISKAANALRDFSTQARADLNAGKDVVIPAIGRFYDEEGKIKFEADPNLKYTPPAIPTIKRARHLEQQPAQPVTSATAPTPVPPVAAANTRSYVPVHTPVEEDEEDDAPAGLNWPRIILAAIVLLALVAIITFAYKKYNTSDDTLQPVLPTKDNTQQVTPAVTDTAAAATTSTEGNMSMQGGLLHFKAIIDSYNSLRKAEKRVQQMRSYGHTVDMIVEDSATFYVVMPISCPPADTTRVLDSLGVLFNPGNVVIY